jgi:large subunit ribosomal protein L16
MLLAPKKWKFRKPIIKSLKGKSTRGASVVFGEYGLKAMTSGYLSNKQIEAGRKVIVRSMKKVGKIWIRIFPDTPFTKKGLEMPMGSGKGEVDIYTAPVRRGKIIFEVNGLSQQEAYKALTKAAKKLPVKARVVAKGEMK